MGDPILTFAILMVERSTDAGRLHQADHVTDPELHRLQGPHGWQWHVVCQVQRYQGRDRRGHDRWGAWHSRAWPVPYTGAESTRDEAMDALRRHLSPAPMPRLGVLGRV